MEDVDQFLNADGFRVGLTRGVGRDVPKWFLAKKAGRNRVVSELELERKAS